MHHLSSTAPTGWSCAARPARRRRSDDDEQLGVIELAVEEMARHRCTVDRRRRLQRHPARGQADRARDRARRRRAAVGQPVLQPPEPARDRRATTRRSCAATELPILLYNIPQRTGSDMPNDLLAELAQLDHIAASSRPTPPTSPRSTGCTIYAGNDDMLADVLDLGEPGGILTSSHMFGDEMRRMVDEPERRREIDAGLQDVYRDMAIAPAACSLKAALEHDRDPGGAAAAAVRRARRRPSWRSSARCSSATACCPWRPDRSPRARATRRRRERTSCGSCRSAAWARSART